MSLFQRIKTPFSEMADEDFGQHEWRAQAVGQLLAERRQELGLRLDEVGAALRIKPVYLAALEQGRAQDLPGATYAIGFIRSYAEYLGLDGEHVLGRFKEASADVHMRADLALPVPLGERSLPGLPILLVGLILALCGYGSWYYLSTGERSRPERVGPVPRELEQAAASAATQAPIGAAPAATAPATATAGPPATASPGLTSGLGSAGSAASPPAAGSDLVASPASAALPTPSPEARNSTATAPPAVAEPAAVAAATPAGQIDIRAITDCWIQVRAPDQSIVFSRVLKAGETYHVPRTGLAMRTGNAGALAISVDGKPAPPIGGIGVLRRNVALDPAALLAGTAAHG